MKIYKTMSQQICKIHENLPLRIYMILQYVPVFNILAIWWRRSISILFIIHL